jgi:hypothetical protein
MTTYRPWQKKNALCSEHEGKQLPQCWAHMTGADHIVTCMLLLVISSITILEVQTTSTGCTPSPTTETILRSDLRGYPHQPAPSSYWQTTKHELCTLQNCIKRSHICLQVIYNTFRPLISLHQGNHTGTSEEITAGFIFVSHMHSKCNI